MMKTSVSLIFFSALACVAQAQQHVPPVTDDSALTQLFHVDQATRQGKDIDWAKLRIEDEERRQTVRKMLAGGEVRTSADYFHAALVFQHGEKPEDYLLAHILAINSIILGNQNARWLAAATLDRYLSRTGKPQAFGTQFGPTKDSPMGQLPLDPDLLSDSVRVLNCIVPLAEQARIVEDLKNKAPFRSTNQGCQ